MSLRRHIFILLVAAFLGSVLLYACKEKYTPNVNDINPNYFVVEGLINTGSDSTLFTLSRTFNLDKKAVVAPEKGAIVQVESDAGSTYVLPELVKSGNYGRPALNLDQTKKYRLRIRTKDNKEYLSDFVESKTSPPVGDVTLDFRNNLVNVQVNTQDPSGKSKYYMYSYIETWEQQTQHKSLYKVENHQILPRKFPEEDIFTCWRTVNSSNIVLGATTSLTEDRLEDRTLIAIPAKSTKLTIMYSILVKQTVLTKEAFDFWEALRKNTESVGSIFDVQPSQLVGNIICTTNPAEVVIGFISAGTTTQTRFWIKPTMLPEGYWHSKDRIASCFDQDAFESILFFDPRFGNNQVISRLIGPDKPDHVPIDEIWSSGNPSIHLGYSATSVLECVDCRLQGGVNKMPAYWK